MSMKIIAIGKKHESWVSQGIERYEKRLTKTFQPAWNIIPHSSREGIAARHEEFADRLDDLRALDEDVARRRIGGEV